MYNTRFTSLLCVKPWEYYISDQNKRKWTIKFRCIISFTSKIISVV